MSRWCGWSQAVSQILVACCFLYMAFVANRALISISETIVEAKEDLHSIQQSMLHMNNELHTVNTRMEQMNTQVDGVRRKLNPFRMFSPF